jgi:hypothetical protein
MEEEKPKNKFFEILKKICVWILGVLKAFMSAIQGYMTSQWKRYDEEFEGKKKVKE